MGSTGYQHGITFTEAMRYELSPDVFKILAKAEGEPEYDRKVTWFAVERIDDSPRRGERFIMQALWHPATERHGVTIKLVDESMGMYDYNVPDKVWAKVPDAPADSSEYAIEWRRKVAEFKAKYPLSMNDLIEEHWYVFPDREDEGDNAPVQYLGKRPSGRSTVKAFLYPPADGWTALAYGRIFRLRRGQERHGRARRAERPSVKAAS